MGGAPRHVSGLSVPWSREAKEMEGVKGQWLYQWGLLRSRCVTWLERDDYKGREQLDTVMEGSWPGKNKVSDFCSDAVSGRKIKAKKLHPKLSKCYPKKPEQKTGRTYRHHSDNDLYMGWIWIFSHWSQLSLRTSISSLVSLPSQISSYFLAEGKLLCPSYSDHNTWSHPHALRILKPQVTLWITSKFRKIGLSVNLLVMKTQTLEWSMSYRQSFFCCANAWVICVSFVLEKVKITSNMRWQLNKQGCFSFSIFLSTGIKINSCLQLEITLWTYQLKGDKDI